MKVILEGDFTIADMDSGKKVLAGVGDVFYFEKGVKVRFETEKGGLAFFTGGVSTFLFFVCVVLGRGGARRLWV